MKQQHWADIYATRIIKERGTENSTHYTCASGITPSGTVHIGNFREIISVELVVRALQDKGVTPRFIYSWDDFDVFRKVPLNIPSATTFDQYLRMPITDIPDPWKRAENYAFSNEQEIERILSEFGIYPHYIYQAEAYKKGVYSEGIRKSLEKRKEIKAILDKYRTQPLPDSWWPISVFSSFTNKDTTRIISWNGAWDITYYCEETGQEDTIDIRTSGRVKLLWRIDWPMRWEYEQVVFEPAGKDHHSYGGSFDTAKEIVSEVYQYQSPITFQYGFVSIKGGHGKLSSSSGEVISVSDMQKIYQPEVIRYLFASTRPNAEFSISFDIDVIKIYEDYDKCERIYFGVEKVNEARMQKESRIYELSQTHEVPPQLPLQIPIRHLCNLLQIHGGDKEAVLSYLQHTHGEETVLAYQSHITVRMICAWNWISEYAPEDFKFCIRPLDDIYTLQETNQERTAIHALQSQLLSSWNASLSPKDINTYIYNVAETHQLDPQKFFTILYMRLIGKEKGPRLGNFLHLLGKDIVIQYFK